MGLVEIVGTVIVIGAAVTLWGMLTENTASRIFKVHYEPEERD